MPVSKTVQDMDDAGQLSPELAVRVICPMCGVEFAGVPQKGDKFGGPHENDPTVCFGCGEVLIFHGDEWVRAKPEEIVWIFHTYPVAAQVSREIKAAHQYRNN